ncbi:hypothetical protein LEP1GSC126_0034 [Leptospira kirschneri str. 200801774]|uniref:hypothetical protein n=1 Tax=Leptospira kirschneri TaxID=29507 RepID=UPI0002BF26A7|nr:hypothetical protein [Leptospira kirschneri]EMO78593.1 hypothetical protein LEP1GSC126_0034 [Leptospira kirschneri str. 200801774]
MKIKLTNLFALLILVIYNCVTIPTNKEIISANYGPKPDSALIEVATKVHVGKMLLDPQSVQWGEITKPRKVWTPSFSDSKEAHLYGWGVCITYNAKNQFGGYTGFQPVGVLFRNGEIVRSTINDWTNRLNGADNPSITNYSIFYDYRNFCPTHNKEFWTHEEEENNRNYE